MLIVSCTSGLCNRIHAILGAKRLAAQFNRSLTIFWARNLELDVDFTHIFSSQESLISRDDLLYKITRPEVTSKVYSSGYTLPFETDQVTNSGHDVILIKPWFVPLSDGPLTTMAAYHSFTTELATLQFSPDILRKATPAVYADHVGVHVRMGDPTVGGELRHAEYFSASSVDAFKVVMDAIVKVRPVRFYVASPVHAVKEELARYFDVDFKTVNPHRGVMGVKDAVVDLLHLAACSACIGSVRSQFTKMVGLLSQRPVYVVGDSNAVDGKGYAMDVGPTTPTPITLEKLVATVGYSARS